MPGSLSASLQETASVRRLSRQALHTTYAVLVAVALMIVASLFYAMQRSNAVSVERQERVARHALDVALGDLALQQETVAVWDESIAAVLKPRRDDGWIYRNTSNWLYRIFGHDLGIIIGPDARPIHVVVNGQRAPNAVYDKMKDLRPFVDVLRGGRVEVPGTHDRLPGVPLASDTQVRTTGRTYHMTRLGLIEGRPAAISAMQMRPSRAGYVGQRSVWPILLSVRYLDARFMAELEAKHLMERPRFSTVPSTREGEYAIQIPGSSGSTLGYLIWTPELPGSRTIRTLLPVQVAALLIIALLMTRLVVRLRDTLRERARLELRARKLAFQDSLTGLPNRALLGDRLVKAIRVGGDGAALLLIDLDRFKQVNDTLGHLAGDQLIQQFADRLAEEFRSLGTIGRLGGDEFAIVLPDCSAARALASAEAVLTLFHRPFDLMSTQVFGGASIGAAHTTDPAMSGTELMRRADVALYCAKGEGRGVARLFARDMDAQTIRRSRLEVELRRAIHDRQFALWAQPLVDTAGREVGQELLLRWDHPSLGTLSPSEIIPVAEETGLIAPIGDWIVEEALATIGSRAPGMFTALNLSPVQLRDDGFAGRLLASCRSFGVAPGTIELEITEQVLLDDSPAIRSSLAKLRKAGFRLALDDFGTGYSSLGYLRRFTVDKIKIDRSFVADITASSDARAIIAAIVNMGQALGLTIAAEGVETREQADLLRVVGCNQLQGHFFAMPRRIGAPPQRLGTAD